MRQVTQRELAQKLGLTQAAVSLALRHSTRVSAQTRARVLAAAEEMGYRADPALGALARRRWSGTQATLAYVGPRGRGQDADYPLIAARCRALGLSLWRVPPTDDDSEVQRQLDRRKVAGVILSQSWDPRGPRRLAWDRLRAVHHGLLIPPEGGDVVAPDLPSAVHTVWREVKKRGYRTNIGAIMFVDDARVQSVQLLTGALLAIERTLDDRRIFEVWIGTHRRLADAAKWVRSRRCEAVIGYYSSNWYHLVEGGARVPFAAVVGSPELPQMAGTQMDRQEIADAAVDLLVGQLDDPPGAHRRRIHLLDMPWRDGATLPPKGGSLPA